MIREFDFGTTKEGKTAKRYQMENSKGMQVEVSDFGAVSDLHKVFKLFGNLFAVFVKVEVFIRNGHTTGNNVKKCA